MNIDFTNKKTIALLSAVGILAVATIAAVVILLTLPGKAIQVEDFSGKTVEEIKKWATEKKLGDSQLVVEYEYSDTVDKDKLISQRSGWRCPCRSTRRARRNRSRTRNRRSTRGIPYR